LASGVASQQEGAEGSMADPKLADVEASIVDVFLSMIEQVRYLSRCQSGSNISRQRLHPLWQAVRSHVEGALFEFRAEVLPCAVKDIEREVARERYESQRVGQPCQLSGCVWARRCLNRAKPARDRPLACGSCPQRPAAPLRQKRGTSA
jgi:hypothetical protein